MVTVVILLLCTTFYATLLHGQATNWTLFSGVILRGDFFFELLLRFFIALPEKASIAVVVLFELRSQWLLL